MNISSSLISLVLIPLLAVWPVRAAIVDTTAAAAVLEVKASATPSKQGFTVQVNDDSGAGVADAAVLVRLPDAGTTGTFRDGTHAAVGYTDANGRVEISGIQWSAATGSVPVTITVSKGETHAGLLLEQSLEANAMPAPASPPLTSSATAAPAKQDVVAPPVATPVAAAPLATAENRPEPKDQPAAQTAPAQPGIPQAAPMIQPRVMAPNSAGTSDAPSISIVNDNSHEKFSEGGSSHKKWYILAAIVAAGAGAGVAMMGKKSSSSSSSTSTTGVSIGTPTVSVGAP